MSPSHHPEKIPTPLKAVVLLTIFACGFTVCANLTHLIPTNPHYDASWSKVIICSLIALVIGVLICREK
jgi:uncharacterized membrane protein YesL